MRRLLLAAALGLGASVGAAVEVQAPSTAAERLSTATIRFPDGFALTAELALTPESQERGLMFRTEMGEDRGMLFVFPSAAWVQFWMKNTWIDLDMAFIGDDRRITRVYHRVPRSYPGWPDAKVARVPGYGRYVLELARGVAKKHKLKAGDRLDFKLGS